MGRREQWRGIRASPAQQRRRIETGRYRGRVRCPYCGADHDKVVDSRPSEEGVAVRRRRECLNCGRRFTTYERYEEVPLLVQKRSGAMEPFDRDKLVAGIER